MEKRKQFLHLIIGSNGSGKTYFTIQIAIDYLKKYPNKRILIIVCDDGERKWWDIPEIELDEIESFTGVKKLMIDSQKEFEYIANVYKPSRDKFGNKYQRNFNGLMICDDLGGLMNRRPEELLKFFKKRRQPNIDFLFIFHGLRTDVPPSFFTYVNYIYLFRTSDNHEETMKHLPSGKRDYFEKKYFEIQKLSETEPHEKVEIIINPLTI